MGWSSKFRSPASRLFECAGLTAAERVGRSAALWALAGITLATMGLPTRAAAQPYRGYASFDYYVDYRVCPRITPLIFPEYLMTRARRAAFRRFVAARQPHWTEVPAAQYRELLRQYMFAGAQLAAPPIRPSRAQAARLADDIIDTGHFRLWVTEGVAVGRDARVNILRLTDTGQDGTGWFHFILSSGPPIPANATGDFDRQRMQMFIYAGRAFFVNDLGIIYYPFFTTDNGRPRFLGAVQCQSL